MAQPIPFLHRMKRVCTNKYITQGGYELGSYDSTLGTPAHYNSIIFGDHTALQADCEGALAVGGDILFGSIGYGYDVGTAGVTGWESTVIGKYDNPHNYPSFLLGGVVTAGSVSSRIYAGELALREGYRQAYENGSFHFETVGTRYLPDSDIAQFFSTVKTAVTKTSGVLLGGSDEKISFADLGALQTLDQAKYESHNIDTNKRILVYTIDCAADANINIGDISLGSYITAYDCIVINAPAAGVTFSDGAILYDGVVVNTSVPRIYTGNELIELMGTKIIFNFPQASQVSLQHYGLLGSLVAPNAAVIGNGGSINGMLIANSLNQSGGMELHAFTIAMGDALWELDTKSDKGSITVKKLNELGETPMSDAVFSLYKDDTHIASGTTDGDGLLSFDKLAAGIYKLVETAAPRGYALPEENEWVIELTQNEIGKEANMETIYIRNALKRYEAKFTKLDYDNHSIKLAGAVFSLYKHNAQSYKYDLIEENLTTNAQGELEIDGLLAGEYRLVEITAPAGYYLPPNAYTDFEITSQGENTHQIYNKELGKILICKIDSADEDIHLPDAQFNLYEYNMQTHEFELYRTNLITDADGNLLIEQLEPGEYKLIETQSPEGYQLPENPETLFTITL